MYSHYCKYIKNYEISKYCIWRIIEIKENNQKDSNIVPSLLKQSDEMEVG